MKMNSHNTKPVFTFYKTPALGKDDIEEAKIVSARLTNDTNLSIEDDADAGFDPYNTTGQHLILRQKKLPKR
jgi:hypothetical protein